MAVLRSLLLIAPLLWAAGAAAKDHSKDPPPDAKPNPQTACYMRCMNPFETCRKKCAGASPCISKCAKEMSKCTDACGGPPASMRKW